MTVVGQCAWGLLVLLAALLVLCYQRLQVGQRYAAARRVALVIRFLHPADGWKEVPPWMEAMAHAQRGEQAQARKIYQRFQENGGPDALYATAQLYRLTNQWEEFMEWRREQLTEAILGRHPVLIPLVLRAFGETGDLNGLAAWFEQAEAQIERLPVTTRGVCRLTLYAFSGRRAQVERYFDAGHARWPAEARVYWLALATGNSGDAEAARAMLTPLGASADHLLRGAAERRLRLGFSNAPQVLSEASLATLERAERLQGEEERFVNRSGFLGKQARVTLGLLGANVGMFSLEMLLGGSMDADTLIRLGALVVPAGDRVVWWRLGASLFLHYGVVHLLVNMLALVWLGPFVERAFGRWRFLVLYLGAGVGAATAVWALTTDRLLVGASGSIMGLIGASAAIAWRGWKHEKARAASRQLRSLAIVIVAQTLFDIFTPHISLIAHLSGVILGFLLAWGLGSRRLGGLS